MAARVLEENFSKILDDAKGNLSEVKNLAGIAESVGTQAFLEIDGKRATMRGIK